MHLSD